MASVNPRTVLHASLLLFNHVMIIARDVYLNQELQACFKQIDECLNDKTLIDADTLFSLLLCECRILYQNTELCTWLEDNF